MILTYEEILESIPQQKPFRFIDKINFIDDFSIECSYTFKQNEFFYEGHFPGDPRTPGVILVEAATQMTNVAHSIWIEGKKVETKDDIKKCSVFITDINSTDFIKPVFPGETVTVYGKVLVSKRRRIKHEVVMKNNKDEVVMTCIIGGLGIAKEQ